MWHRMERLDSEYSMSALEHRSHISMDISVIWRREKSCHTREFLIATIAVQAIPIRSSNEQEID